MRGARWFVMGGLLLVTMLVVVLLPPIAQDPSYHCFADEQTVAGIPNFLNVVSNVPFLCVGAAGMLFLRGNRGASARAREHWAYGVFFLGVLLSGLGSAYYHLAPDNARLVWDRLPMTLAFMSFFAAMIAERVHERWGIALLCPLVLFGAGSVFYWHWTELAGMGDLRPYLAVQFFPLLAIPLLVLLWPAKYTLGGYVFIVAGLYALAKVFEELDAPIFELGTVVSGHTLKHLAAAAATYWVLRMIRQRQPVRGLSKAL